MTGNAYKPPAHPMLQIIGGKLRLDDGSGNGNEVSPAEAISLGLALMETGLYLKELDKCKP